jgi:hypothetical protein
LCHPQLDREFRAIYLRYRWAILSHRCKARDQNAVPRISKSKAFIIPRFSYPALHQATQLRHLKAGSHVAVRFECPRKSD